MFKITEVNIQLAPAGVQDRLRGFCSITLESSFVIRDIKIINGPNGDFVAMPSRKIMAPCPECRIKNHLHARFCNNCGTNLPGVAATGERLKMHCDIAHPINAECRKYVESEILNAFRIEALNAQQPGYVSRQLGDGGDSAQTDADRSVI